MTTDAPHPTAPSREDPMRLYQAAIHERYPLTRQDTNPTSTSGTHDRDQGRNTHGRGSGRG